MKKSFIILATALGISALAVTGCKKNISEQPIDRAGIAGLPSKPQKHVPVDANSIITVSRLSADTVWLIDGISYVAQGSSLTIEPGTYLTSGNAKMYNDPAYGPQNIKGVLVVPRGSKIFANGTADKPIVFTSPKPAGQRAAGDFGGIVILGNAHINQPTTKRIEGIPEPADYDVTYGTPNGGTMYDYESSGILEYVRIEFAGYVLSPDNEINGLTLGGVGSGTKLSHIQVSWSADDAFEFFGGSVNASHLVALSTDDDDFDFDFGYNGTIYQGLSLKDPNSTYSKNSKDKTMSDSNGLESDNDGKGSSLTPITRPVLRNFTFMGIGNQAVANKNLKFGNRWRRSTAMDIQYSIIAGYGTGVAFENITAGIGDFSNNLVHGYTAAITSAPLPATYVNNKFYTGTNFKETLFLTGGNDLFYTTAIGAAFSPEDLVPTPSSAAYGDGYATYKGAFSPSEVTPWTAGWTNFAPTTY